MSKKLVALVSLLALLVILSAWTRVPFAFREIVSRGEWDAPELVALVKAPNRNSLLTLLALRKADAKSYQNLDAKLRAAILVDALRTSKQFNVWGPSSPVLGGCGASRDRSWSRGGPAVEGTSV